MPVWFIIVVSLTSCVAGATASVVGFGVGSLLTPVIALRFGAHFAIAAVVLPHLAGGVLRGWLLRDSINWSVAARFGVMSAISGLLGALLFALLTPTALTRVLGALLVLTASAGITGWSGRWTPHGKTVWVLGALSGFFGGVVGNQGGLRAAALTVFGLAPAAFVATSTLVGVAVDVVRAPVYLHHVSPGLVGFWAIVTAATAGVLAGTLIGDRILLGLSPRRFGIAVSVAVGVLGLWFLLGPG